MLKLLLYLIDEVSVGFVLDLLGLSIDPPLGTRYGSACHNSAKSRSPVLPFRERCFNFDTRS